MGASLFVFTAMMSLDPRMPAMCWIWPDTPQAMYALGLIWWPDRPIQCSSPSHLRSAAMGRLQPTAPPGKHLASASAILRSPCCLKPRPTPTTTGAAPRSKEPCFSPFLPVTLTLEAAIPDDATDDAAAAPASNVLGVAVTTALGPIA